LAIDLHLIIKARVKAAGVDREDGAIGAGEAALPGCAKNGMARNFSRRAADVGRLDHSALADPLEQEARSVLAVKGASSGEAI